MWARWQSAHEPEPEVKPECEPPEKSSPKAGAEIAKAKAAAATTNVVMRPSILSLVVGIFRPLIFAAFILDANLVTSLANQPVVQTQKHGVFAGRQRSAFRHRQNGLSAYGRVRTMRPVT